MFYYLAKSCGRGNRNMALKLAGESGIQEVVDRLYYAPGVQDSGDLEAATRTITATAKPGTPDYTANLTLPTPPSPKLTVLRACLRLQVTIDSFGGSPAATRLSYAVEVNGIERLTGSWTATGAQYAAGDLTSGQFNVGSANQYRVYLWVDQGNAVVSLCQLWQGIGSRSTSNPEPALQVNFSGLVSIAARVHVVGSGSPYVNVSIVDPIDRYANFIDASGDYGVARTTMVWKDNAVCIRGAVGTDISILYQLLANLRRLE